MIHGESYARNEIGLSLINAHRAQGVSPRTAVKLHRPLNRDLIQMLGPYDAQGLAGLRSGDELVSCIDLFEDNMAWHLFQETDGDCGETVFAYGSGSLWAARP
jgi:hypothetical protein